MSAHQTFMKVRLAKAMTRWEIGAMIPLTAATFAMAFTDPGALPASPLPYPPAPEGVYVYDDRNSGLVEIFDFRRNWFVNGGDDMLRNPGEADSEFAGALFDCGNDTFYCLQTALHIAVPRQGLPGNWSFSAYSCAARPAPDVGSDTFRIGCRYDPPLREDRVSAGVDFVYSPARGVISYRRICPECGAQDLVLVGTRGIFAQTTE